MRDLLSVPLTTVQIKYPLRVLVGCERSGIVRDAFLQRGHDAWSCDLAPDLRGSNRHIRCDVRDILGDGWDLLMVAHPPCTRLCNSGVRWLSSPPPGRSLPDMWRELDEAADFFSEMWNADIPRIAVENPIMHRHAKTRIRNFQPHTQSFHPWQFGTDPHGPDNEKKRICMWLRGLPLLVPTGTLDGKTARDSVHKTPGGPRQAVRRARFFPGVADAMAEQWGGWAVRLEAA
jgi:hypothetical protein